jgi:hypothetical protein
VIVDWHTDQLGTASAAFSEDRVYRYALTRRWAAGAPLTAFVMLNPSTAGASTNDTTIRRCIGFARTWGTAGIVVVNLFGLISTDPDVMRTHPDPVGPENDKAIAAALTTEPVDQVVAAWGTTRIPGDRHKRMPDLIRSLGHAPMCLGVTVAGHPRHPLYLAARTPLEPYPAEARS